MTHIGIDKFSENSHLRNKGGYTSQVIDMGVQWDFGDNCGHRRFRNPIVAVRPHREHPPDEGFFKELCGKHAKVNHNYLKGDLGHVCTRCGLFIEHGCELVKTGPSHEMVEFDKKRRINLFSNEYDAMMEFANVIGHPFTCAMFRSAKNIDYSIAVSVINMGIRYDDIVKLPSKSRYGDCLYISSVALDNHPEFIKITLPI
tara:strand:- start:886 stop:1488 length:603 start_codon:yes stop_codon:yes gene_type:complete